jgi:hypothetical protein
MTPEQIYEAWAPAASEWSAWVKPVLFAHLSTMEPNASFGTATGIEAFASQIPDNDKKTALVLDLPGAQGAQLAVQLAERGFRPVPLYNSCPPPIPAPMTAVDVLPILDAIATNGALLQTVRLPANAPPAFLLDVTRRYGRAGYVAAPGAFDNRSISLPTDFPSSSFLLSRGIRRAVLIQHESLEPQADLSHTLLRWQDAGIAIGSVSLAPDVIVSDIKPLHVRRPWWFRTIWYAFIARMGLRPNPLGGFGGILPQSGGIG